MIKKKKVTSRLVKSPELAWYFYNEVLIIYSKEKTNKSRWV